MFISGGALTSDLEDALRLDEGASASHFDRVYPLGEGTPLQGLDGIDPAFDDWLRQERSALVASLVARTSRLLDAFEAKVDDDRVVAAARLLLRVEPTDERAGEALMAAYMRLGRPAAAAQVFRDLQAAMSSAFSIAPSERTVRLYLEVRKRRESATSDNGSRPDTIAPVSVRAVPLGSAKADPSLAIMPLSNATGDTIVEPFLDGLGEELVGALYRFRWIKTLAYASFRSFRNIDHSDSCPSELIPARYALTSAVFKIRAGFRLSVRLLMTETGEICWANSYNFDLQGHDAVQEELASEIAREIDPRLLRSEIVLARTRPPSSTDSFDHVLRAIPYIYERNREKFLIARSHLERALEIDPYDSSGHCWLALWHMLLTGQNWVDRENQGRHFDTAEHHARLAVDINPDDAQSLAILAHAHAFYHRRYQEALDIFERAVDLNPNLGFSLAFSSATLSYTGQAEKALARLQQYKHRTPYHPHSDFLDGLFCVAHSLAGHHREAVRWGRRLVRAYPSFSNGYKHLIANLGSLGEVAEATLHLRTLQRLEPDFTVSGFVGTYPLTLPEQRERIVDGLRRAGVPL